MKRFQLVELEDLAWFPARIRDCMTDYLQYVVERFDLYAPSLPVLARALERSGGTAVLDLGSGGGGSWGTLAGRLAERVPGLTVTLSDFYPNRAALGRVAARAPDVIRVEPEPVDARAVPASLEGLRTQFLSLHHFPPDAARAILRDAVERGRAIAVFEAQRRDIKHLIQFAFSPITVLLFTPLIRPVRLARLLFTYLIPIVPLAVGFDGIVSVLRTYTAEELLELTRSADPDGVFDWEVGELEGDHGVLPYLLGVPR